MKRLALLGAVLAASAAAGIAHADDPAPNLEQFDRRAIQHFRETLRDPLSAIIERYGVPSRGKFNSGPFKKSERQGYWQCYRVHAKNGYGGYTGFQLYAIHFQDNDGLIGVAPVEFTFDENGRHCTGKETVPVLSPVAPVPQR